MKTLNKFNNLFISLLILSMSVLCYPQKALATGISIDAGLTPSVNRWMLRSQMRYMKRDNDPSMAQKEMKTHMFPLVLAYGLKPNLTIMIRQGFVRREMSMMGQNSTNTGLADFLILGKYRLTRINTSTYTMGIAPTLGLEIPTGNEKFTSNSYDLRLGSYFSGRLRSWGMDLNITYVLNGIAKTNNTEIDPGNEFSVEAAFAKQLSFGTDALYAIAPVIESSYFKISSDNEAGDLITNTGESVFLLSPGIKITRASFIIESLIQFPIWQKQNGLQTERSTNFLIGFRLMN